MKQTLPIIGFKAWEIDSKTLSLKSVGLRFPWNIRTMEAACQERGKKDYHKSPEVECNCGLYAYHLLNSARILVHYKNWSSKGVFVYGAVIGWGKTIICDGGFRSEKQRILGFIKNEEEPTEELKQLFPVPWFEEKELDFIGCEYGEFSSKLYPQKLIPWFDNQVQAHLDDYRLQWMSEVKSFGGLRF